VALIYVSAALALALGILMFGSLVDRVGAIKVMAIGLVGLFIVIIDGKPCHSWRGHATTWVRFLNPSFTRVFSNPATKAG